MLQNFLYTINLFVLTCTNNNNIITAIIAVSIIVLNLLWPTNGTIRARTAMSIHIHYSMAIPSLDLTLIASQSTLAMALYKFVQCHCQLQHTLAIIDPRPCLV